MPQFFIDKSLVSGNETEISGRDAHHIIDVLRLKAGDWLVLSDGGGRSFRAKIRSAEAKKVVAVIEAEIAGAQPANSPALAFAVIKHDRSEWIIQKAVELGCRHIVPFYCSRTVPKYSSAEKKIGRWREIAMEAAKQSGLPFVPQVDLPCDFEKLCELFANYEKTILFWEGETHEGLRSVVSGLRSQLLLVIGPEGGFEESEVARSKAAGAETVSLGRQILRVETAAIVALALVQYELENLAPWKK